MKLHVLTIFLMLPCFLRGQIILDKVMDQEEQKKTGIYKLNYREKEALEGWLNKHCTLKQKQTVEPAVLTLSINLDGGHQLLLSDGSSWQIDPQDYPISKDWLTPIPIEIKKSNHSDYPVYLVDKNTGTKIRAKPMRYQTTM